MPLSEAARRELQQVVVADEDRLPNRSILREPGYLQTISYLDFLTKHLGVTQPEVLASGSWSPEALESLSVANFARNLIPVTLGNVLGGAGLVGGMYWFVYLRPGARR